jgi:hypothetical protein
MDIVMRKRRSQVGLFFALVFIFLRLGLGLFGDSPS